MRITRVCREVNIEKVRHESVPKVCIEKLRHESVPRAHIKRRMFVQSCGREENT